MKAEYINSFYKAAKDVFQLMVDIEPQRGELNWWKICATIKMPTLSLE